MKRALGVGILAALIANGCATPSTPQTASFLDKKELTQGLADGKAVVFAEVSYDGRRCKAANIRIENKKSRATTNIVTNHGNWGFAAETIRYATVEPGSYWVKSLRCGDVLLSFGEILDAWGAPSDPKKLNLKAPQFTVKAGQILHIGTMNMRTVDRGGLFASQKAVATVTATTENMKKALKKNYPEIYPQIVFQPATSFSTILFGLQDKLKELAKEEKKNVRKKEK